MKKKSPPKKKARWVPDTASGEPYWCLTGRIDGIKVKRQELYLWLPGDLKIGNCFRTKKEALAARKRVLKALKGDG